MSRPDYLWAGLNLSATGLIQAGAAVYDLTGLDPRTYSPNFASPFGASEYRDLVRGGGGLGRPVPASRRRTAFYPRPLE